MSEDGWFFYLKKYVFVTRFIISVVNNKLIAEL